MGILSDKDIAYLKDLFGKELKRKVKIVFFKTEDKTRCQYCEITEQVLEELVSVDPKLELEIHDFDSDKEAVEKYQVEMVPATILLPEDGKDYGIRFYGVPSGHEFGTLIQDIITVSEGKPQLSEESIQKLQSLEEPIRISVFVTPTCPYCPRAVLMAHNMAMASDKIIGEMIEANEYWELSEKFGVSSVPHIVVNRDPSKFFVGAYPEKEFINEVLRLAKG
ncbi:glutaredoxin [Thermotoga maritima MSB8]|uniref:Glutaredoxin-related protein n=1 Tax=Thermotoga maritima (strain ATCC 43589 / DSM 3109 / JCM 10099 / NBRC 100826 / MSB8) TaxID=243274 RepID=Q9WZX2_THEMA|nr:MULTISPECIES: thioredoxin family protein [Thermotoga]AAD35950.1 glutaredoxin-related protein [Thermotoga maritima MSB8]AGL49795.1 glutaredoxin-like protein [Thermotoga maritima MSB8]AHD17379.1 glutaredoxin [Thermotoga maritima MSB8]AIY85611.1 glutaredoxin-related protein [Thermotoga sp. 2812B]AKE26782.1 glutaredoxin [Thermotoga maritima]